MVIRAQEVAFLAFRSVHDDKSKFEWIVFDDVFFNDDVTGFFDDDIVFLDGFIFFLLHNISDFFEDLGMAIADVDFQILD